MPTEQLPMTSPRNDRRTARTPIALWILWSLSVIGTALWIWWSAFTTGSPVDIALMVIRCTLVGVAGLIGLTLIEMRIAPWRFLD